MSATKCVTLLINSMWCSLLLHCFCCPTAVCEGFGLVLLFFDNSIAMISLSYILADAYGMVIRCNGTTEGGREGRREGGRVVAGLQELLLAACSHHQATLPVDAGELRP